jgi:hypothetical protein
MCSEHLSITHEQIASIQRDFVAKSSSFGTAPFAKEGSERALVIWN